MLNTSRKIDAAIGTEPAMSEPRSRLKSMIVKPPKITRPAIDQMMLPPGMATNSATSPNASSPSSAQNRIRYQDDRSRRVA